MTVRQLSQVFTTFLPVTTMVLLAGAAVGTAVGAPPAPAPPPAPADRILGTWSADNGRESKVEITKCGNLYCGTIIWMRMPKNDDHNVEASLRGRPLVAAKIMDRFKFEGESTWAGGKMYNAGQGRMFGAKIVMVNKNELEIYEGEAKKAIVWSRVAE